MSGVSQDLFLGFVKLHILHHAAEEAVCGVSFREELGRHGYDLSWGTLYPIFHRLERSGLLSSRAELVGGRLRKYYSITELGAEVLAEAKVKARELMAELEE